MLTCIGDSGDDIKPCIDRLTTDQRERFDMDMVSAMNGIDGAGGDGYGGASYGGAGYGGAGYAAVSWSSPLTRVARVATARMCRDGVDRVVTEASACKWQ